jgi:hypothetical protein
MPLRALGNPHWAITCAMPVPARYWWAKLI